MVRPTLDEYISIVARLKKPELVALATKYNLTYAIPHPSTLKKEELMNFILRHIQRVYKVYYKNKSDEKLREEANLPPKKERTLKERNQDKLNDDINELIKERKPIYDEYMQEVSKEFNRDNKKITLLAKEIKEIDKKINGLTKYIKVEPKKEVIEEDDEELTPTQIKNKLKLDIMTLNNKIKNAKTEDKKKQFEKELKEKEKILKSL
jgi:hypothetical protein